MRMNVTPVTVNDVAEKSLARVSTLSPDVIFLQLADTLQSYLNRLVMYYAEHIPIRAEILLLLLPFIAGIVRVCWPVLQDYLARLCSAKQMVVRRDIVAQLSNDFGIVNNRNLLLQNAIFMYLVHVAWQTQPLTSQDWANKVAVALLIDPFTFRYSEHKHSPFNIPKEKSSYEDNHTRDAAVDELQRSRRYLDRLLLIKLPTGNEWVPTRVGGIEITYARRRQTAEHVCVLERLVSLRARGADAAEQIDRFAKLALQYFIQNLPNQSPSSRYLLEFQRAPSKPGYNRHNDTIESKMIYFHTYSLDNNRNFDTLFFPGKTAILQLVDDFLFRRGRFAVKGFPYKLGFLLYGPPGTGKRSFIKALATYTQRCVCYIPLRLVTSNQDLHSIFLTRSYHSFDDDQSQHYELNDVIFVLEDFEFAHPLVSSRVRRRVVKERRAARLTSRTKANDEEEEELIETVVTLHTKRNRAAHGAPLSSPSHGALGSANTRASLPDGERTRVSRRPHGETSTSEFEDGSPDDTDRDEVRDDEEEEDDADTNETHSDDDESNTQRRQTTYKKKSSIHRGGVDGTQVSEQILAGMKLLYNMHTGAALGANTPVSLDLSGLLNVLDGVVDTPGRIVIFTTSNPTHLDAALTRPGRFSTRVRMDYSRFETLVSMTGLHFGDVHPVNDATGARVCDLAQGARWSEEDGMPVWGDAVRTHGDTASEANTTTTATAQVGKTAVPMFAATLHDCSVVHSNSTMILSDQAERCVDERQSLLHDTSSSSSSWTDTAAAAAPHARMPSDDAAPATNGETACVAYSSLPLAGANASVCDGSLAVAEKMESTVNIVSPAVRASMAQARLLHRVLSTHQEDKLRRCLARLEAEDVANRHDMSTRTHSKHQKQQRQSNGAYDSATRDQKTDNDTSGGVTSFLTKQSPPGTTREIQYREPYNFHITPSEIELLCTTTHTLDEFIERFERFVRREVTVTEFTV